MSSSPKSNVIPLPLPDSQPLFTSIPTITGTGSFPNICEIHQQPLRLICVHEDCMICEDCALFGDHKAHNIRTVTEVELETIDTQIKLRDFLGTFDIHKNNLETLLEGKKAGLIANIHKRFEELRGVMLNKEKELIEKADMFFEDEYNMLKSTLESSLNISTEVKLNTELMQKHLMMISEEIDEVLATTDRILDLKLQEVANMDVLLFPEIRQKVVASMPPNRESSINPNIFKFFSNMRIAYSQEGNTLRISTLNEVTDHVVINPEEWGKVDKVVLELGNYELIQDEDLKMLYYVYYKLDRIVDLSVKFEPKGVSDESLLKLFPIIFYNARELENVEIVLKNCQINDRSLIFLFNEILAQMHWLRSLVINLDFTKISDQSLQVLGHRVLPLIKRLHTYKIDLSGVEVTDAGVTSLFMPMNAVKVLRVNVQGTMITDCSIECFVERMLKSMGQMESFELYTGLTKVTNKGIVELLGNVRDTKVFKLCVRDTEVTDKSIDVLRKVSIPAMKSLKCVWVRLEGTKVTKKAKDKVVKMQKKMEKKSKKPVWGCFFV